MCHGTEVRAGIQLPVSPAHSFENLQAFSASSVFSLPTAAQSIILLLLLQSVLSLGLELSWKQQPAAPTLPLITTTSLGGRRVLMQQKSTSLLVSYSKAKKGGVCSAEQNSQALQGGQKKMWIFWILVWTKWNRLGIGIFSEEKFNFSNAEEKKNHNALHLFSNTAPLETKGTGRRG